MSLATDVTGCTMYTVLDYWDC